MIHVDGYRVIAMCLKNFKNSGRSHDKDVKSFSGSSILSLFLLLSNLEFFLSIDVLSRAPL